MDHPPPVPHDAPPTAPVGPVALVLFDIAGTLMDDRDLTCVVFRRVLETAGHPHDAEAVRARFGRRKEQVFLELLELAGFGLGAAERRDEAARLVAAFDDAMIAALDAKRPAPLPGALATLDDLARRGIAVGWTTGYARRVGEAALAAIGVATGDGEHGTPTASARTIGLGAASDEVEHGRPAPDLIRLAMARHGVADPRHVITVGDTPNDLLAGTAAGCGAIVAVGHGTHALDELAVHPHTHRRPTLEGFADAVLGRESTR